MRVQKKYLILNNRHVADQIAATQQIVKIEDNFFSFHINYGATSGFVGGCKLFFANSLICTLNYLSQDFYHGKNFVLKLNKTWKKLYQQKNCQ